MPWWVSQERRSNLLSWPPSINHYQKGGLILTGGLTHTSLILYSISYHRDNKLAMLSSLPFAPTLPVSIGPFDTLLQIWSTSNRTNCFRDLGCYSDASLRMNHYLDATYVTLCCPTAVLIGRLWWIQPPVRKTQERLPVKGITKTPWRLKWAEEWPMWISNLIWMLWNTRTKVLHNWGPSAESVFGILTRPTRNKNNLIKPYRKNPKA